MTANFLINPPFDGRRLTMFNLMTGIVTMVLTYVIGFFLSPFIVKHLGAEANGFTQLATNFVTYASLVSLAFSSMVGRFISVSYHRGEIDKACRYYTSGYYINLIIATVCLPLALYVILNLENLVRVETANLTDVKILFVCVFFNYIWNLVTSVVGSAEYVKNAIYIQNFIGLFTAVSQAVLLLIIFNVLPVRVYYAAIINTALSVILFPVRLYVQRNLLREVRVNRRYFSFRIVWEMFKSGVWNTVNQCGHMLNTGFDLLLSNLFISPAAMGVLAIAKIIPNALFSLAWAANNNFSSSLVMNWAKSSREDFLKELRMNTRVSIVIISVPIMTFCSFALPFYRLWMPSENAEMLTIASVLTILPFIPFAGTQTLYNVFIVTNKLAVNSISFIVGGIVNVIAVFLCLRYKIAEGVYVIAGMSSLISLVRNITVIFPYTSRILGLKWYSIYPLVLQSLMCAAINLAIGLFIAYIFCPESWLMLIVSVILTLAIVFFIESYFVLSKDERVALFAIFRRK